LKIYNLIENELIKKGFIICLIIRSSLFRDGQEEIHLSGEVGNQAAVGPNPCIQLENERAPSREERGIFEGDDGKFIEIIGDTEFLSILKNFQPTTDHLSQLG